jgi:hypothetical protein
MVCFQTQNPNFGRFWWSWNGKSLAIWNILWPFGSFVANEYIFTHLGILCRDKSGNPAPGANSTKHDFPNFTHICNIFSQICVKFLANL